MAEASQDRPHELYSDLDLLVEMANDAEHDEEAIRRHLESLKTKLDQFVHKGSHSGGSSAT